MPDSGAGERWRRAARDALLSLGARDRGEAMVLRGLTAVRERAGAPVPFDLRSGRLVVFSDHHRGGRDGADDFLRCERAYRAALAWYLELGHTLVLLGDVEELWEERLPRPIEGYREVLALEREFHLAGRLVRIWGNHDLVWSRPDVVEDHLQPAMGAALRVRESLMLDVADEGRVLGRVLLTHGHQGTPESDLFAPLAKLPVRYVWPALQRGVNFASTTPAQDFALRARHDRRMFAWARREAARAAAQGEPPLLLVTGHTHKPVFRERRGELPEDGRLPTEAQAHRAYEEARAAGAPAAERARLRAVWQLVATEDPAGPAERLEPPCYLNTGCCSFGDGDVTGIELADGAASLVRWLDDDGRPAAERLAGPEPLDGLFAAIAAGVRPGGP